MIQRKKKSKKNKSNKTSPLDRSIALGKKVIDERRKFHINARHEKTRHLLIKTIKGARKKTLPEIEQNVATPTPVHFQHDETFNTIILNGHTFTLSALQAEVVKYLYDQHSLGVRWVLQENIMEGIDRDRTTMRNIFKNAGQWLKMVQIVTNINELARLDALLVNLKGKSRWRLNI